MLRLTPTLYLADICKYSPPTNNIMYKLIPVGTVAFINLGYSGDKNESTWIDHAFYQL